MKEKTKPYTPIEKPICSDKLYQYAEACINNTMDKNTNMKHVLSESEEIAQREHITNILVTSILKNKSHLMIKDDCKKWELCAYDDKEKMFQLTAEGYIDVTEHQ